MRTVTFAVRNGGQRDVVGAFDLHQPGVIDRAGGLAEEGEAGGRQRLHMRLLLAEVHRVVGMREAVPLHQVLADSNGVATELDLRLTIQARWVRTPKRSSCPSPVAGVEEFAPRGFAAGGHPGGIFCQPLGSGF